MFELHVTCQIDTKVCCLFYLQSEIREAKFVIYIIGKWNSIWAFVTNSEIYLNIFAKNSWTIITNMADRRLHESFITIVSILNFQMNNNKDSTACNKSQIHEIFL